MMASSCAATGRDAPCALDLRHTTITNSVIRDVAIHVCAPVARPPSAVATAIRKNVD
jgi:hypothetical protein